MSPLRTEMFGLIAHGFAVRELWLGDYFDGVSAVKRVGTHIVEIYIGSENGDVDDPYYPPVVYVDDKRVACDLSVARARLVADFRALMLRSGLAGSAA